MEGSKWTHEPLSDTWTLDNTAKPGVGRIPMLQTSAHSAPKSSPTFALFPMDLKVTQVTEALTRKVRKGALASLGFHLLDSCASDFNSPTKSLSEFSIHNRVLYSLSFLL